MTRKQVTFSQYETADYLSNGEEIAGYLNAVIETGDTALITAALGDLAKTRNVSQLARDVGMSREGLYKALSSSGNPSFATICKIVNAFGLRISFQPNS